MRSILMILGVVLHSSLIYAANIGWAISSPEKSVFFYYVYHAIHIFRIPTFFLIAGFFSGFTISRDGYKKFLLKRLQRILIPFIATVLTVNIIDSYLRFHINEDAGPGFTEFISTQLISVFSSGEWDYHLWFLLFLSIYFFIAVALLQFYHFLSIKLKLQLAENGFLNITLILCTLPFFNILILAIGKVFPDLIYQKIFGIFNLYTFSEFLPFYILGVVLFFRPKILKEFNRFKIANVLLFSFGLILFYYSDTFSNELLNRFLENYSYYLLTWLACSFCFFIFYTFFNKQSKFFLYLSDASYSIYLFHQVLVIALGFLLFSVTINIYLKFICIVLSALALTIFIHHFFILKIRPLRFLYNGK